MSYLNFYHLKKEPFNVTPDPEFLFLSPSHKEALGVFIYGITKRKGIVAVIGEVGVGKTTVLRSYLEGVDAETLKTIYLFNANVSFADLMRMLCEELNVQPKNENVFDMVNQVHLGLIEEYKKGRNVVLIVDEAQNMPVDTLENLRMLSNLETSKDKLIQIALIGQPELEEKLNRHELRQLKQRIAVRATIRPLTTEESMDYIQHRLAKCRMKTEPIFSGGALKEVIKESRGIPRLMNILCDNALITGFGYQQRPVGTRIVREVITDFKGEKQQRPAFRWAMVSAAAIAFIAVVVWAFAFRAGSVEESTASPGKSSATAGVVNAPPPLISSTPNKKEPPTRQVAKSATPPKAEKYTKPAQVQIPATKSAQANAGIGRQIAPNPVKTEPIIVAQNKEKPPAPAERMVKAPAQRPAVSIEKPVIIKASAPQVSKKATDDARRKTTARSVTTKEQTPKYARNTNHKHQEPVPKRYAEIEHPSDQGITKNATPRSYPYNPPAPAPNPETEIQNEVPSELVQTNENTASNDSPVSAAGDANGAGNVSGDTEGAGSSGRNVVEPLQDDSSYPASEAKDTQQNPGENNSDQVDLTSEVAAPRILRASKPIYPYSAQLRRIEGTVIVSILVSPTGDVEAVRILRSAGSNYGLDQAAVAAVKRWRFTPAVKNGKRVRVWVSYPILFKLQ